MRLTLQRKLILMLLACVTLCAIVLTLLADIEFRNNGPAIFHHGSLRFFASQFERLWNEEKYDRVQLQINELEKIQDSQFQWLDKDGHDLLGGEDQPTLAAFNNDENGRRGGPRRGRPSRDNRIMPIHSLKNGRHGFLAVSPSGEFFLIHWVPEHRPLPAAPLFLSISAILIIFGILISRNIGKPVTKLNQTMAMFGNGNLGARSDIMRNDEIGQLAISFNDMAQRLENDFNRERLMVRNIAHEVRTPLTRMLLLMERINTGIASQRDMSQMEMEIQDLAMMPQKLIELSDIEQGRCGTEMQPIDVISFLETSIEKMHMIANQKNCRLKLINFNATLPVEMETDPDLLARAIENVIDNAIRHCPENSEVHITIERKPDNSLLIQICDEGPGVPEADLPRIFSPFFRSDQSRNLQTGGLGLGLSIARSIVTALGGKISAINTSPGLKMEISLPA